MRIILYLYTTLYFVFAVWVVHSGFTHRDPLWKIVSDGFLFLISLFGLLFYMLAVRTHTIVVVWRVVSLVILVGQVGANLYDRQLVMARQDSSINTGRIPKWSVMTADVLTVVMILPAIALNIVFAYF